MSLEEIYQPPRTTDPRPAHRIYSHLIKGLAIDRPNQVRCADITCMPAQHGFLELVAIMAWTMRHAQAWRLWNNMDAGLRVEAYGVMPPWI